MRWVLEGVGSEGVTIRLCVWNGMITLYISQFPNPNNVRNDHQATVATKHRLAVNCSAIFEKEGYDYGNRQRRQQALLAGILYISIEGHDNVNKFSLTSTDGNVTYENLTYGKSVYTHKPHSSKGMNDIIYTVTLHTK